MLAPFGVEQGKALTSACPGQGQTDSRTTTHSKFSWFPKLPDSNSQRGPWVTDVPPDAGRHPLRYQSELETGSLVPNFYHGSAVWLKGPKAKCQRGHVITWLYKIYIRQVKLTYVSYDFLLTHTNILLSLLFWKNLMWRRIAVETISLAVVNRMAQSIITSLRRKVTWLFATSGIKIKFNSTLCTTTLEHLQTCSSMYSSTISLPPFLSCPLWPSTLFLK